MRELPATNDRLRDATRGRTNEQSDFSRWAKRCLLPFLPLWVVIAVVVLAFLAWFAH